MAEKDLYIAALEKKLAELSGIEVDQIKKNQVRAGLTDLVNYSSNRIDIVILIRSCIHWLQVMTMTIKDF